MSMEVHCLEQMYHLMRDGGGAGGLSGDRVYGKPLYLLFSFAMNLKLCYAEKSV